MIESLRISNFQGVVKPLVVDRRHQHVDRGARLLRARLAVLHVEAENCRAGEPVGANGTLEAGLGAPGRSVYSLMTLELVQKGKRFGTKFARVFRFLWK